MLELAIFLTIVNILLGGIRQLYFYQLKEYRLDRLLDFLKFDKGARQIFRIPNVILYLTAVYTLFGPAPSLTIVFILILILVSNVYFVFVQGFYRPKKTKKALLIFAIYALLLFAYLFVYHTPFDLNVIYVLSPFVLLGTVVVFMPVTKLAKEYYIRAATKKIADHDIKVIGITGSYGKSSAKEFLETILSEKFEVLKTPKNINTDIGVARIILSKLRKEHQVFIVEMGAYKKGEIKKICDMVKPEIGILTAVAKQHLSLFGSFRNIKRAKGELLESVRDGLAIINGDSKGCLETADELGIEAVSYGLKNVDTDHLITELEHDGECLSFKLDGYAIKVHVLGDHQSLNVAGAIIAAQHLEMTGTEIFEALKKIEPPKAVLSLKSGFRGSIILDDSYNSNPDGFIAAIKVAKDQKVEGKKILITMGMIELGKESDELHREVGRLAGSVFDLIITTRREAYKPFQKVVPDEKLKLIEKPAEITAFLKKKVDKFDLILIENRLFDEVKQFLLS